MRLHVFGLELGSDRRLFVEVDTYSMKLTVSLHLFAEVPAADEVIYASSRAGLYLLRNKLIGLVGEIDEGELLFADFILQVTNLAHTQLVNQELSRRSRPSRRSLVPVA